MKTSDFNYDLPERLIAQHPSEQRDHSRLLVLEKKNGAIAHRHFYHLPEYLDANDVLVINNTRVIPARLYGIKVGGSALIEVLLLKPTDTKDIWEVLVRPGKRMKVGHQVMFADGLLMGEVIAETDVGRLMAFHYEGIFEEILEAIGTMPLPPYIHEKLADRERYQTIYAKEKGSTAAPTAGLHFTPDIFEQLQKKGVEVIEVLLHVGLGTFKPVSEEEITEHKMHSEYYHVSQRAADAINQAKAKGKRIVSVGTTSTRVLESATVNGILQPGDGETDIFIYPGYQFQMVDALITNFHLPKSTLMMLVSALAGREHIMHAYQEAVQKEYRFFSFGDAMFIQ